MLGSDLKIYHDGSNNYIEGQTGSIIIQNTLDDFNVIIKSDNGSGGMADYFRAKGDTGSALMYHYGSEKLATTSTGIDVTGTVTMDGGSTSADFSFGDSDKAIFGAGSDLQIYHDGLNSIVADAGTGQLRLLGDDVRIYNAAGTEISAQFIQDGEARLKYNNSTKLATKTGGIEVTGTVTADGLTVDGTSAGTLNIVNFLNTDTSANQTANRLGLGISNSAGANYTYIEAKETGVDAFAEMNFYTGSTTTKRLTLSDNGDISFYNDSAAQGLFWDSSASRLGLGTTALSEGVLTVKAGGTNYSTSSIILEDSDSTTKSYLTHVNGTLAVSNSTSRDDFLIDSSGAATFGGTVTASGLITATAGINLPTVNTYITGNGHNVLQVDGTRTYFYGGTNGVQFRTADNASGLVDITNTGNIKINSGNLQIKTTGQIEDNGTRLLLRSTGDASGLRFDGGNYTPFKNGSELMVQLI